MQWLNYSKVGGGTLNSSVNVELVPVVKFSQNTSQRCWNGEFNHWPYGNKSSKCFQHLELGGRHSIQCKLTPATRLPSVFLRASAAMLKHVLAIGWTSVCLSVRLSVTRWYCIKMAEYIVMLSSQHDSPFILVLCISRSS